MTTDSYTGDRRTIKGATARSIGRGFALVLMLSVASTAALLIATVAYVRSAPARIASSYSVIAAPANHALTADLADYNHNRTHHLGAAKSDLRRVSRTVSWFDGQLLLVTFPTAAQNVSGALTSADRKLRKLIWLQMRARTLRRLRSFDPAVEAAAAAVKTQARAIRHDLGLPASSGPLF